MEAYKDNIKLINALKRLRDLGNTVVVVEHDTETMENADHIMILVQKQVIMAVLLQGSYKELLAASSITGKYLSNKYFYTCA